VIEQAGDEVHNELLRVAAAGALRPYSQAKPPSR
jgi:hypothetical protein